MLSIEADSSTLLEGNFDDNGHQNGEGKKIDEYGNTYTGTFKYDVL